MNTSGPYNIGDIGGYRLGDTNLFGGLLQFNEGFGVYDGFQFQQGIFNPETVQDFYFFLASGIAQIDL